MRQSIFLSWCVIASSNAFSYIEIPSSTASKRTICPDCNHDGRNILPFQYGSNVDAVRNRIKSNHLFATTVNGESASSSDLDLSIEEAGVEIPESPPLSFRKFLTMQEKRVIVTIIFTENSGLKTFFITAAQRIKQAHPDVLIAKRTLPNTSGQAGPDANAVFEIQVDGKKIVGNGANKRLSNSMGTVFVPMTELGLAVAKARKRRRPATNYGGDAGETNESVRLEMLMKAKMESSEEWADYDSI